MLILNSSEIILFGGINENNQKFNELYNFDFKDKRWTILFPSGEYPASRTYHNMILHDHKIFVFAGYSNTVLNDCYVLNFNQKNEKEISENYLIEDEVYSDIDKTYDCDCKKIIEKNKNTIFFNCYNKNEDPDYIENNIDKALVIGNKSRSDFNKLKENLLFFEYKEEIKLLKNQVNELKSKIENEVNKNSCKVNQKVFLKKLILIFFLLIF